MNHIRNIKEMLSIPTGSRNVSTSGISSFTDSQIFFGSQFWQENSQTASQDMSLSSRTSQQSSQEGSDPKFLNSYHTKPLLFGELNEKCKTFGVLDFEEDKKKAKEKSESEFLAKECQRFRETLNNIQQLVIGTEKNTTVCKTVLEKIDNFASTMQNKLDSLQSDISQKFETLLNKVDSQKEMMTDLDGRMQKSGEAMQDLCSNLQSLKNDLECLREEQVIERNLVEEALKLISTIVSEKSAQTTSESMMESANQTSPGLVQQCFTILQNNKLESTQLTCMSPNPECIKAVVPFQESGRIIGRRKFTLKHQRKRKKRQLVLSHRSKHTVTDENIPPLVNTVSPQNSLSPDSRKPPTGEMRTISAGCIITPLSCWSQDSNSSMGLRGIEPMCLAESRKANAVKLEGFWQLFDMDYDSVFNF